MTSKSIFAGAGVAVLAGLTTLGTTSCKKDFIDLSDPTRIPSSAGYTDSLSILGGVTAAYSSLQDVYGKSGSNRGLWVFSEVPSDNSTTIISGEALNEFDFFSLNSNNPRLQPQWTVTYRAIYRCNIVIDRAGSVKLTAATRNRYLAEARFIRALTYFNAVRIWGDIPLVTKEITSISESYTYARESRAKVYAQIEEDLAFAEANLPAAYPTAADLGRATKGAAQGLLGKVLLTQKKYAEAASKLKQVIDANAYSLQASYANIFLTTNEMNSEILFAVRYAKGGFGLGSPFTNNFALNSATAGGGSFDQFNTVDKSLFDAFTASGATDVRNAASIGSITGGTPPRTQYYTKKYTDTPTAPGDADNDWIVLRYADVLLLYAEAANEQGATTATSLEGLNRVIRRSRGLAVNTPAPAVDLPLSTSPAALRDRIELERRLELNMEGHRWFDLVRTDRAIPVMNAFFTAYNITNSGAPITVTTKNLLFPIPIQEIQVNPILTQNDGYN